MSDRRPKDRTTMPGARPSVSRPTSARPAQPKKRTASAGRHQVAAPARQSTRRSGRNSGSSHGNTGRSYGSPTVWTKDTPQRTGFLGTLGRLVRTLGRGLLHSIALIGRGLAFLGRALFALIRKSRIALVLTLVVAVGLVGGLVDFGLNANKAYPGVHVGDIDASGKTSDEIATLIEQTYGPRLAQGTVTVYANEEAAAAGQQDQSVPTELNAEQQTAEEERANRTSWTVDALALGATLPASELADRALAVGREEGGLPARLSALFGGWNVEVALRYGAHELEELASTIDEAIGNVRVDFGFTVDNGVATVTEGHDGEMLNRETFAHEIDRAFLSNPDGKGSFVARVEHAPIRIDADMAQATCDDVNSALAGGARFVSNGARWDVDPSQLGSWVASRVEEREGAFALVAYIDETKAKPAIVSFTKEHNDGVSHKVSFTTKENGEVLVYTQGAGELPHASETTAALNEALFGPDGKASRTRGGALDASPVEVEVFMGQVPETLSFDEALNLGVIEAFSSYTTSFSTGSGSENRNHNIALVSELLSDSIIEPDGSWSFNDTAGECSAETGFLDAGSIVDGEYTSEEGGGICQVATTVFNAVYDSGLPITTRHNHSLYIATYPAGRDAAVSWPDLDLVWKNDTESAILVRLTCEESSVTATLYGVGPDYRVSTQVGEWEEGEKYTTKTERDDKLAPGTSYVKTRGTDGSKISIVRTVTDALGTVLHEDLFASQYDPINEVIVAGPDTGDSQG